MVNMSTKFDEEAHNGLAQVQSVTQAHTHVWTETQ